MYVWLRMLKPRLCDSQLHHSEHMPTMCIVEDHRRLVRSSLQDCRAVAKTNDFVVLILGPQIGLESGPHKGSTDSLWNNCVVQILSRFVGPKNRTTKSSL